MDQVFLGLGSNKGDRLLYLQRATREIGRLPDSKVRKLSAVYETEPYGVKNQEDFLNAVVELQTGQDPERLLGELKSIEAGIGRTGSQRWGPREIDIDLLIYGTTVLQTDSIVLPHGELHKRRFVLEPLAELAPEFIHPGLHTSISDLLSRCPDKGRVHKTAMILKQTE